MQSISLINISFAHAGADALFNNLSAVFSANQVAAIVGDNGAGKSTLLKLISGEFVPDSGRIVRNATVAVMPQMPPHDGKSGGQRQMTELARVFGRGADIVLLDEPTNNLDAAARQTFYDMLARHDGGAIIVTHDRDLLRRVDCIVELAHGTLTQYGGNYDFYAASVAAARERARSQYTDTEKRIFQLRRSMVVAQNMRQHHESKQKKDAANARWSKIDGHSLKGKSRETEAARRNIIQKKLDAQQAALQTLSVKLRTDTIKIPTPSTPFPGTDLVHVENMSFGYGKNMVFSDFNLDIYGGQHIRLTGPNGCGKSTLLKLITGRLAPSAGIIRTHGRIAYLDQDLSLLNPDKTVVENIMDVSGLLQHDAHIIAANFGFRGDASRKRVGVLSGGELLRATLAAVLGGENQPALLILDEPTNNLDINSTDILADALRQYSGAMLLVSHDADFVGAVATDWINVAL